MKLIAITGPIKPSSPWSNAAEMNIRELKPGSSRKMLRSHAPNPKNLWDNWLELEAFVRLCTAVPETVMKGQPANISNICGINGLCTSSLMYSFL